MPWDPLPNPPTRAARCRRAAVAAVAAAVILVLGSPPAAWAQTGGGDFLFPEEGSPVRGTIVSMDWQEVRIETRGGKIERFAPPQIARITFQDEPNGVRQGREALRGNQPLEALKHLEKVDAAQLARDAVREDYAFLWARAHAELALAGQGEVRDAGRLMAQFARDYPQSMHRMAASRLLGDLAQKLASYDSAARYYGELAASPWPELQLEGEVLVGDALRAGGKIDQALASYQKALDRTIASPSATRQKQRAQIGRAACLVERNEVGKAVETLEGVIQQTDSLDAPVMAAAYNALGDAYRKHDQPMDAVLAYLHVHLLYPHQADAHAEALYRLVELWPRVGKPQRADQARQKLVSDYKNSSWAQKLP